MCGILGGIGSLDTKELDKGMKLMAHRGPDNLSSIVSGPAFLAHARLSIIDLSAESNQPMWDSTNSACIVFNGEIYNYKQLRCELETEGVVFSSHGDAEVLLNLYLVYGEHCLDKLSGIFSFAIWDVRYNQLFLARDNYGVKPLYYVESSEGFYFASELKSLLCVKSIKKEINHDSLYRSLVFLWSPGEETLIKGIKKLKPGHFLVVQGRKIVKCQRFWDWPKYNPDFTATATEHQQRIISALDKAVNEQLVADVKVGSFLSGGLDSSLIVSLATKNSEQSIRCFTIDTGSGQQAKDGFEDDLPYAKRVAEHLKVELDTLKVTPDIAKLLPKMIYHLDELQADPAPISVLLICEQAKAQGIKVLLSGAGGDDIFTGYRRHYAVTSERYWGWLPSPFRSALKAATSLLPKDKAVTRRIAKAFQYADLAADERLLSYFFWLDPTIARSLFKHPDQISDQPFNFIYDEMRQVETKDPVERMLTLEQKYFLVDHNFNYTDKMSMAAGVEVRVPFLDKRVVEAASKVPSSLKQEGRVGKVILKKAAERLLPKDIIYRPKSGFGAPLRTWLKNDLAGYVDTLLSEETINKRGIFSFEKVQQLLADDRSGKGDYSYPIFALLCFEIWCQQFLD
ncbi:asparagine synthase (glutamine-hydrolyzing) [Vibrio cholerae]|uniref:asparagine synthase (glutamine-hydrolyzing) n=1 Tax=Vibrio cholerae TaxID=666 RepID=UPI001EB3084F|nr:asparagine synthase (glutamine-hydrolyzing) [Vibrio cholerae]EGQ7944378.1 asparagine synthase (glutamine-hydrolyzing) [Vibrio cholerae]MDV2397105.1 asparagine synthase (glutamine-hydrolyzing) [Vibrio cholerae]